MSEVINSTEYIGWYDTPDQKEPTHDPGPSGKCVICHERLGTELPIRTASIMACGNELEVVETEPGQHQVTAISLPNDELPRSYFYRFHIACAAIAGEGADTSAFFAVKEGRAA